MGAMELLVIGVLAAFVLLVVVLVIVLRRPAPVVQAPSAPDPELQARAMSLQNMLDEMKERLTKKDEELERLRSRLSEEGERRAAAETKLQEAQKNIEEQKKLLDEATTRLADTFKALSSDALKSNNAAFLQLAGKTLDTLVVDMKGDFGKRQEAISSMIKPLGDVLKAYDDNLKSLEVSRQKAYVGLEEHIKMLGESSAQLRKETDNLVKALRKPHVRGKWGELTLRRTAELAGMVNKCDFFEQQTTGSPEDRYRPDMVVNLPGGRRIVIDSKAPLDAYLDMLEAGDEDGRKAAQDRHARQIKTHMKGLAAKEYWTQYEDTPEFVVMFLPGETFLSAALEVDQGIMEEGFEKKVLIATPTTLVALLKAGAYGWRQEQVADNARKISDLGKELYSRICTFMGHFEKIRSGLQKANESFNSAVGSMERMVLPSARKFKELGATTRDAIPEIELVNTDLRILNAPEDNGGEV